MIRMKDRRVEGKGKQCGKNAGGRGKEIGM